MSLVVFHFWRRSRFDALSAFTNQNKLKVFCLPTHNAQHGLVRDRTAISSGTNLAATSLLPENDAYNDLDIGRSALAVAIKIRTRTRLYAHSLVDGDLYVEYIHDSVSV